MIICVYHGSTVQKINNKQTKFVTDKVSNYFTNQEVVECYYSNYVYEKLKEQGVHIRTFHNTLEETLKKSDEIYILITNMITGKEYQKIIKSIKELDKRGVVKTTNPLLSKEYIEDIVQAIKDEKNLTVYVGHGSVLENGQYEYLEEKLSLYNNYVLTLKDNFENELSNKVCEKNITLKPLMFISGFHVMNDINYKVKNICIASGYIPKIDLEPLCKNEKIINLLINKLEEIIYKKGE